MTRLWGPLAGFLLVINLLIGGLTLLILGLSVVFGSGGFGGDAAVTAADRASESRAQFAGVLGVGFALAAGPVFVRLRHRPDVRLLVLGAVAFAEAAALALLIGGTG